MLWLNVQRKSHEYIFFLACANFFFLLFSFQFVSILSLANAFSTHMPLRMNINTLFERCISKCLVNEADDCKIFRLLNCLMPICVWRMQADTSIAYTLTCTDTHTCVYYSTAHMYQNIIKAS